MPTSKTEKNLQNKYDNNLLPYLKKLHIKNKLYLYDNSLFIDKTYDNSVEDLCLSLNHCLSNDEDKSGWVYLSHQEGSNLYKIGHTTRTINQRLNEIQSNSGSKINLIDSFFSFDAFKDEKDLHKKYKHLREHHEWFKIKNYEAIKKRFLISASALNLAFTINHLYFSACLCVDYEEFNPSKLKLSREFYSKLNLLYHKIFFYTQYIQNDFNNYKNFLY
ncbi:MAG: GIY-YIG nuclease family protein, partial [Cyanobacteria bacterium P01_A01_bin.40]